MPLLNIQPKTRSRAWWLWIVVALLLAVIAWWVVTRYSNETFGGKGGSLTPGERIPVAHVGPVRPAGKL